MALSRKSLAGPGYIILNILRVMNIIALMSVIAASVVMLVKTFIVSKFFFFDAVSNVITAITSMFLIVSELPVFKNFFARNWPLLSPNHGFVALGVAMMVLGTNILGNLNKESTSQKSLGMAFWRIVIASGILVFVLGFFNIVASYVFRDTSRGITARLVRAKGAVATAYEESKPQLSIKTESIRSPISERTYVSPTKSPFKATFDKFSQNFRKSRQSILPTHESPAKKAPYPASSVYSSPTTSKRPTFNFKLPISISRPMGGNGSAEPTKPDPAHHPSTKQNFF